MKKVIACLSGVLMVLCLYAGTLNAAEGRLTVGIIPELDLATQMERYAPLMKYLEKKIGMKIWVKPFENYGLIYEELRDGKIEAGFFGSFVYGLTRVRLGIEPIARPVTPEGVSTYAGYTFVRKDSGIKGPQDMRGRTIALVDPATTAGYIAQKIYFKKHGLDIDKDVRIFWAGDHDSAARAVFKKRADMGGAKSNTFKKIANENPDFKASMVVLDESLSVPENVFAVKVRLDSKLKEKIRNTFESMDKDSDGRKVLKKFGASRFIATKDEDYKNLYAIVKEAGIDLATYSYGKK
ncbi:MAG TPA: phosphate/phosphite/phosphonate ABC transporter substrate-binding protein [Thermodesulfovibrionales bacterium]|nr:phosphate/phosphite/phosphonate ABC transporter substrate-binding protein [Thermodesulfovibrionales bacterium]